MRIPIQAYQTLIHAAEISGASLNQFIVQAPVEKAQMIIENYQIINLSIKSGIVLFNAIESPPKPGKNLKNAMKAYRESFGQF